ncbi:hypothetical protein BGY98DRAFT_353165 [Russula aff. rugulosa BPL654]|nr:hypothetical protein BGY98DRAFT_353165 [Russula aff. rugulosa BPL654]
MAALYIICCPISLLTSVRDRVAKKKGRRGEGFKNLSRCQSAVTIEVLGLWAIKARRQNGATCRDCTPVSHPIAARTCPRQKALPSDSARSTTSHSPSRLPPLCPPHHLPHRQHPLPAQHHLMQRPRRSGCPWAWVEWHCPGGGERVGMW